MMILTYFHPGSDCFVWHDRILRGRLSRQHRSWESLVEQGVAGLLSHDQEGEIDWLQQIRFAASTLSWLNFGIRHLQTECLEWLDAAQVGLSESSSMLLARALRCNTALRVLQLNGCNLSGRPLSIIGNLYIYLMSIINSNWLYYDAFDAFSYSLRFENEQ